MELYKLHLDSLISNLWLISRTALSTQDSSRHSRMIYIKRELINRYADKVEGMTGKQIWLHIENTIN